VSFKVLVTPTFKKQAKRLAKKYRSLELDLSTFSQSLQNNPLQGKSLGNNTYKVRLRITSKGKGKSGGMRAITYIKIVSRSVFLVAIYDKSERGTITDAEINNSIKEIA
jgi:mRNA-degrading endonuclease RelE of RelBE toxin-antitoxin system